MAFALSRATSDGPSQRAVGVRTGVLFDAHGRMVFAVCRAILHDAHEAEDATQATFLSAHEALLGDAEVREAGAWLATIARNECRARLRSRGSEPLPLREELVPSGLTTDNDVERRTIVEHLHEAIASLPEKQREAVVLRDLYGLHYREIGLALGVSGPSVEALLFRARRTLRVRLRPVAGGAIAVPVAVREGLAQAIPWFATIPVGAIGVTSSGLVGGIGAKIAWPVALKVAVGAAAVGIVAAVLGTESPPPILSHQAPAPIADTEPGTLQPVHRHAAADTSARRPRSFRPVASRAGDAPPSPVTPDARLASVGSPTEDAPRKMARASAGEARIDPAREPFQGRRVATGSTRPPRSSRSVRLLVPTRLPPRAAHPAPARVEASDAPAVDEGALRVQTRTTAVEPQAPEPDPIRTAERASQRGG